MRKFALVLVLACGCSGGKGGQQDAGPELPPVIEDVQYYPVDAGPEDVRLPDVPDIPPIPDYGADKPAPICFDPDGDGIGEGCPCNAYVTPNVACYESPFETRNVGECKDGLRQCHMGYFTKCLAETPPALEVCNHKDDDCDGVTDEDTTSPCGPCAADTDCGVAGANSDSPFYPNPQKNSKSIGLTGHGELMLTNKFGSTQGAAPQRFIWIANSPENTVSRLDTGTGYEVARYQVCPDPSRTAVDLTGNGIITCRGDGSVSKVAIFESECVDANQNKAIDTSKDADGDHKISPSEMVAGDECILWKVLPDGQGSGCGSFGTGCARAAGVDKDDNVWVGFWNSKNLRRLNGKDGTEMKNVPLPVRPYGLAIDKDQTIWIASRDPCAIAKVDPVSGTAKKFDVPMGCAYGIAVDPYGAIWVANYEGKGIHRFDPKKESFSFHSTPGSTPRGVAVAAVTDPQTGVLTGARVFAGDCPDSGSSAIPVVNALTLQVETPINLGFGGCPVGVAIDSEGFLWTVNQSSSNASKVDLSTNTVVGTYPVGSNPYTYSDMTGYALNNFVVLKGFYKHVIESKLPGPVQWVSLGMQAATPDGTHLDVRVRAADTMDDLGAAAWSPPLGPSPPATLPFDLSPHGLKGHLIEIEITMYSESKDKSPIIQSIEALSKSNP
jgi:DNA-binding beta-propeller fold protein YncE